MDSASRMVFPVAVWRWWPLTVTSDFNRAMESIW
jgi:hypothetical protein